MAPTTAPRGNTRTAVLVSLVLAVAVLVLYAQTARFEFIILDDNFNLLYRPVVREGLSVDGLRWALRAVDPNWSPVVWVSHMVDFSLFGVDAGAHHLTNAGLHALNAVLLFLALRTLTGAPGQARSSRRCSPCTRCVPSRLPG